MKLEKINGRIVVTVREHKNTRMIHVPKDSDFKAGDKVALVPVRVTAEIQAI